MTPIEARIADVVCPPDGSRWRRMAEAHARSILAAIPEIAALDHAMTGYVCKSHIHLDDFDMHTDQPPFPVGQRVLVIPAPEEVTDA